ncbi:EAL domain-containing response regulator [Colwellia sp. MSW7]|uniref:EAL domain-containing response regulator n=1 Tax=Colwellia maritima TaxID=2912588 RepID=A0ABS9X301_9GAMM|nr:EAL domain-containing response regulator [Colwellia maritima]MCI2284559.1 EAL domain-containing response regulator [Colwellia maritima]
MDNIDKLNLCVMEDDDFQRKMLIKMLHSLGVTSVLEGCDGEQMPEVVKNQTIKPDIVLCDLNMPNMDGLEFLRHLGEAYKNIAVIIISSLDNKLLVAAGKIAKMHGIQLLGVIGKPVMLSQLESLLSKFEFMKNKKEAQIVTEIGFTLEEVLGIHAKQIVPFFQAKVDLKSNRLIGAESLARRIHPKYGVVSPYYFIPILENSNNIDELTFNMLENSATACRSFHDKGYLISISVNLSLVSLSDPNLSEKITQIVRKSGVENKYIVLEITESAAMTDIANAMENLTRLRMNGFSLSIDDYGTGYSSMQQLTRVPFNELKIDQSFVHDFGDNEALRIVVESSIHMAHKLHVKSVAEGVETQQDWDMLKSMKCDIAQGYFISKPIDLDAFHDFMKIFNIK